MHVDHPPSASQTLNLLMTKLIHYVFVLLNVVLRG